MHDGRKRRAQFGELRRGGVDAMHPEQEDAQAQHGPDEKQNDDDHGHARRVAPTTGLERRCDWSQGASMEISCPRVGRLRI